VVGVRPRPLIAQSTTDRGVIDSVFVFTNSRLERPVTLLIDELDPRWRNIARHRYATVSLARRQALRIALHLLLAAVTPGWWALETDEFDADTDAGEPVITGGGRG
jgi:hypothetical protein